MYEDCLGGQKVSRSVPPSYPTLHSKTPWSRTGLGFHLLVSAFVTEFGKSFPDRRVIENIGIMLTDMTKFLHKSLITHNHKINLLVDSINKTYYLLLS